MATLSGDVQLAYTNFAVKLQVGQITAKLTYSFSKGGFRIQAIFHSKLWFLAVRPNTTALDIVQICGEINLLGTIEVCFTTGGAKYNLFDHQ